MPASAATLDRIRDTGHIRLGYRTGREAVHLDGRLGRPRATACRSARPSSRQLKIQLGLPDLAVDWVAVSIESRFAEVQQGNVDLLCLPTSETLTNRKQVSFSLPVFAGGKRAVMRADAAAPLASHARGRPA